MITENQAFVYNIPVGFSPLFFLAYYIIKKYQIYAVFWQLEKGETMDKNLIIFDNMTRLLRAKEILRKNGIYSQTVRTPAGVSKGSCGYSLKVRNNYERAFELIKNSGIRIVGASAVDYN